MRTVLATALLCLSCTLPLRASAQDYSVDLSQIDASALLSQANDVVLRASDGSVDALFQAALQASRIPRDATLLCALVDPNADRGFENLAATANRLSPSSRKRFGDALTGIAAEGLQNPRQRYDAAAAEQTLKQAGVTAMLLNDGFLLGMAAQGNDAASREARCKSFGWLLDALKDVPQPQRAAAMRLLLSEGLARF